jgi:hypothetical protein
MAYLRVEKRRFLFLKGSTGTKATAVAATVALPDASAARAASSVDHPRRLFLRHLRGSR